MNPECNPRQVLTSQIMDQGLNIFWCSSWFAMVAFVGCDRLNNAQGENKFEIDKQAAHNPTTVDSVDQSRVQVTVAPRTIDLEIDVSGFGNCNGTCRIAVYIGKPHFNDPEFAIAKESLHIIDSRSIWQVQIAIPEKVNQELQSESGFAVSAYHDENDNSRLDKSTFGIPTERYGFSKNPKRGYGPPKFSETAIEFLSAKKDSDSRLTLKVPIQIK